MNYHHFYDVQIQFDTTKIGAVGTVKEEPKNPVITPKVDNVKQLLRLILTEMQMVRRKMKLQIMMRKRKNSKTADTAQLGLYMVLLLGSLAFTSS